MEKYILLVEPLSTFENAAENAKSFSTKNDGIVEFGFNGIRCIVDKDTDTNLLYRDYSIANALKLQTIGPRCKKDLDQETLNKLIESNKF